MKFGMDFIGGLFDTGFVFVQIQKFGILRMCTLLYLVCFGVTDANAFPKMHWTDGYQIWNARW